MSPYNGQVNVAYIEDNESSITSNDKLTTVDDILRKKMSFGTGRLRRQNSLRRKKDVRKKWTSY